MQCKMTEILSLELNILHRQLWFPNSQKFANKRSIRWGHIVLWKNEGHCRKKLTGDQSVVQIMKWQAQTGSYLIYLSCTILTTRSINSLATIIFYNQKAIRQWLYYLIKKRTELYKTEEIGHIALVAAMASHAALASSRIPTNTRLPSKNFHCFPTQCSSKVASLCISSSAHVRRCFSGFLVYWDC